MDEISHTPTAVGDTFHTMPTTLPRQTEVETKNLKSIHLLTSTSQTSIVKYYFVFNHFYLSLLQT